MKLLICKNGKTKYKAEDGLAFEKKEHCEFYERKYMSKKIKVKK